MPALLDTTEDNWADCDTRTLLATIGTRNVAAISGLRVLQHKRGGVTLPVASGYKVTVDLAGNDTYTVRRVLVRGTKVFLKGERTDVYAEDLGEAAYQASCYVNVKFGDHDPMA